MQELGIIIKVGGKYTQASLCIELSFCFGRMMSDATKRDNDPPAGLTPGKKTNKEEIYQ